VAAVIHEYSLMVILTALAANFLANLMANIQLGVFA
jgi:hypothetical protein